MPSPVLLRGGVAGERRTRLRGRLIPWPWTLNVAGRAERYATRVEACAGIRRALARTLANRIDAGLGQVNLGYHAHRYEQPCELLDRTATSPSLRKSCRSSTRRARTGWSPSAAHHHWPAGGLPAARYRRSVHQHLCLRARPGAVFNSFVRSPMP